MICIWSKNVYCKRNTINPIIFNTILFLELYVLAGVIIGALLQRAIEFTDQEVTAWDATAMVFAWPIMVLIFIYYFIQGLLS